MGPTWAQLRPNLGSFWPSWARQSILAKMQFHRGENAIFEVSRGPKTTKNGSSRATWPDLGLTWAHLASHGPTKGQLGPTWGQLGTNLGPVWANFGPVWATLGHLGANLGRSGPAWASSGPIWAQFRSFREQLGLICGLHFGATWVQPGANRGPTDSRKRCPKSLAKRSSRDRSWPDAPEDMSNEL